MKKRLPEHRYLDIRKAVEDGKQAPDTGPERDLHVLLQGKDAPGDVSRAYDIFAHTYKRETLESLLLAGATPKEIEKTLGVSSAAAEAYRRLFFDTHIFENALDRIEYAGSYERSEYGRELKKLAVNVGKDFLCVRLSGGNYTVSPELAKGAIRATAYMMALLAKANPIDSNITREAHRWAQVCLKASDDEKDVRLDDAQSLRIELEKHEVTESAETTGIPPEDILH